VRAAGAPRAAIFDMDGVLIDSEPHHHAAWRRICLEAGIDLTLAEVAERTLGRPVRESLPALLGRPVAADELARLTRRKAAFYEEASGGIVREVPGAVAFVRGLAGLGVRCALATSAMPERVERSSPDSMRPERFPGKSPGTTSGEGSPIRRST